MMKSRKPVILVVDDEVLLRMLAAGYFDDAGYEVIEASSGPQALALLKERPDILAMFTDVQMPGRPDGVGLANEAHDLYPDVAIVVMSANKLANADALAPNIQFITKPYDGRTVLKMFDEMLSP